MKIEFLKEISFFSNHKMFGSFDTRILATFNKQYYYINFFFDIVRKFFEKQ